VNDTVEFAIVFSSSRTPCVSSLLDLLSSQQPLSPLGLTLGKKDWLGQLRPAHVGRCCHENIA
jgi:hypothetical protein